MPPKQERAATSSFPCELRLFARPTVAHVYGRLPALERRRSRASRSPGRAAQHCQHLGDSDSDRPTTWDPARDSPLRNWATIQTPGGSGALGMLMTLPGWCWEVPCRQVQVSQNQANLPVKNTRRGAAFRVMFQVTQAATGRFLLGRGLRFGGSVAPPVRYYVLVSSPKVFYRDVAQSSALVTSVVAQNLFGAPSESLPQALGRCSLSWSLVDSGRALNLT